VRQAEKGQGLVEATFVLLAFFALLLGVIDCAQVLFAHQALVERVRSSVRWGVVHRPHHEFNSLWTANRSPGCRRRFLGIETGKHPRPLSAFDARASG
jgi:hypothetical protein